MKWALFISDMNDKKTDHLDTLIICVGQAGKPLALALPEKGWKTALFSYPTTGFHTLFGQID
jgi:hypothetical protein